MACGANTIRSAGTTNAEFRIGEKTFQQVIQIIEGLNEDLILGAPFLIQEGAIVEFERKCMYLGHTDRKTIY